MTARPLSPHFRSPLLSVVLLLLLCLTPVAGRAQLKSGRQTLEPERSWKLPGCTADSVKALFEGCTSMGVHGIWGATADGAVLALIPGTLPGGGGQATPVALMVIMQSPRAAFARGTVCGWLYTTARPTVMTGMMFTAAEGNELTSPHPFKVTLTDADHLELIAVRGRFEFRPLRMLPFMYRLPLIDRGGARNDLDGLVRIWPSPVSPIAPRYL